MMYSSVILVNGDYRKFRHDDELLLCVFTSIVSNDNLSVYDILWDVAYERACGDIKLTQKLMDTLNRDVNEISDLMLPNVKAINIDSRYREWYPETVNVRRDYLEFIGEYCEYLT